MTASQVSSYSGLLVGLGVALLLNILLLGFIVVAKFARERREAFATTVRDALAETLMPLLDESYTSVRIPPPRGLVGVTALETIVGFIAVLKGEVRARLVSLLEDAGYVEPLVRALGARDAVRRARTAMLLGATCSTRGFERLADVVRNDPAPEVRIVAAEALGAIDPIASIPFLLQAAREPTRYQELRIAGVLSRVGPVAALALEEELRVTASDGRLQRLLLDILIEIGFVTTPSAVIVLLRSPDAEIRARAATLLGTAGIIDSVPDLLFASADSAWYVRLRIVKALALLGLPEEPQESARYLGVLEHLLYDDVWYVRRNAAAALAAAGPEGRARLASVNSDIARSALRLHDIRKGSHQETIL